MKRYLIIAISLLILVQVQIANGQTLRARDMNSEQWRDLYQGKQAYTVEFREGDEIPVSFASEGDFLESTQPGVTYVRVKKSFWLKLLQDDVNISLDGEKFKKLSEVVTGSFTAGTVPTQPNVPVNAVQLLLKANLK